MLGNLNWYARRLRAMSLHEVRDRASRSLRHGVDATTFLVAPPLWRSRWYPDRGQLLCADPIERPLGFLDPAGAAAVRELLPEEAADLVAAATRALEGRYRFFGYPEVVLGPDRSRDADPFSGRPWPRRHAKRVDYRRAGAGDPKWIWELNRCQELPLLAAAWLVTDEDRYARAVAERLDSWIQGHPPGRGIAWSNGFEAGMRAISLAVALDALRGSAHLPPERAERVLLSLWQHARWIERDPSTGSSANNHRIGELSALVVVGCLAPELADASRLLENGVAGLEHEVAIQIRPDGTSSEQAFAYHVFVLDLLLVATAALDAAGHTLPPAIRAALERSGDALWAQLGDDEPEPSYGDSDDSRALVLDGHERRTGRGVAAAIAARLSSPKAARAGRALDATSCWLFGETGAARFSEAEEAEVPGSITLPDGGLTILRAGRTRLTFDHGPHGHLGIAAHAHADALSVEVSLGDSELVADPGVGSYARPPVREAFRGTGFHATVCVDGSSSSTSGGPFLWSRHAVARLLFADLENGVVLAEHDGYRHLDDPVTHRRAVALLDDEWIVVLDRLEGREPHRYSQRWPLHPRLELVHHSNDCVYASGDGGGLSIALAASGELRVTASRGHEDPPLGWWSERLESVVPSWLVSADIEAAGAVHIASLLAPDAGDARPAPSVRLEVEEEHSRVEVLADGATRGVVEVSFTGARMTAARELVANGRASRGSA